MKNGEGERPGLNEDLWHRRQALQLAAQLPDDYRAALAILDHMEVLVRSFVAAADARPAGPTARMPIAFQSRRLSRGVARRIVRNRYSLGSRLFSD